MASALHSITTPRGFTAAAGAFGMKASGKPDLALIVADEPSAAAAVFTTAKLASPSVTLGREHLRRGRLRAIVVNSGYSNASTGKQGLANTKKICQAVGDAIGCDAAQVLSCSTGVIGPQLPMDKLLPGIDALGSRLDRGAKPDADAAAAIMTTDLRPKTALTEIKVSGKPVAVGGIAKGSGMIAPNMATMLAFITTDAAIDARLLRRALTEAVNADASFNRISVDSDTSPSDTVAVMASGAAGNRRIATAGAAYNAFVKGLSAVCADLAQQIISDGEGATRIMRVTVRGAPSDADAAAAGRAVVESPLVKTALHGSDPNWGRLTMAVGKSGARFDESRLCIRIGSIEVYRAGRPVAADEASLEMIMRQPEVPITIDLRSGRASTVWLGCDLSREYITINADYRT